jgi:iron complex transport system substrate-binding protein
MGSAVRVTRRQGEEGSVPNRSVRWLTAGLAVVAFAAFAACGSDDDDRFGDGEGARSPTPTVNVPGQITDSDGSLALPPAKRIVSLSPGATEIIYALGAQEALVAVDMQADYPEEAANFETKVDAYQPNIEAIAALEPDLVIVPDNTGGIVPALQGLGVRILYNDLDEDLRTVEQVIEYVGTVGAVTGHQQAAEELQFRLRARVEDVKKAIARPLNDLERPLTVYHELDSTFYSASERTFIGDVYALLRAVNIAGDGGGVAYPQLTQEAIIAANPDVIVLADEEFGVTVDSVKARPGWDAIAAVRNDRIYGVDPDIISRPGPRIVDALELLASRFYPASAEEDEG